MLNNKICRVCGRQKVCKRSVNLFDLVNRKYLRHLQMITGLRLEAQENAPGFMCLCCQMDLRSALAFRKLCIKTQKQWLTIEEDPSSSESQSEEKPELKPNQCAEVSTFEESDDDRVLEETFQILIEEEPLDNSLIHEKEGPQEVDCSQEGVEDGISDPPQKTTKVTHKPQSVQKINICDVCGTPFVSRSSFLRHKRKHAGDRPFCCKKCDARFLSAAELRGHRLVHTGGQPFACRYCERKYVSYMGRVNHERTHTNERPFVCEECGKTFTYSTVLKNHMVIHTGERHFRCDLCDRSFQRKEHLVAHFRTLFHHQNVEKKKSNGTTV
ncbi:transcription factor Ouib isoform X1 [Drosophila gunungcola]|uniref:transcription factor Ouib isoform X1 n=1 Tax=Drosophila gunungcola TaxID=103775 RepID=UPI0022DFA911|nr:transcription factor Ouib isoform X1 [Drosophila gunungcola]